MKKVLLTAAAAFASFAMLAQVKTNGLTNNSTRQDSLATMWNANKVQKGSGVDNSTKITSVFIDFSDTTGVEMATVMKNLWYHGIGLVTGEAGGNTKYPGVYLPVWKSGYLEIPFNYVGQSGDNYSACVNQSWTSFVKGSGKTFNPFVNAGDSVKGIFVNMSNKDYRKAKVVCQVVGLADSATIRMDLCDANGRQSNLGNPSRIVRKTNTVDTTLIFNWNGEGAMDPASGKIDNWEQDVDGLTDGWSDAFNEVAAKGAIKDKTADGLPMVLANGTDPVKLDTAYICKWMLQFDMGSTYKNVDQTFTLKVKSIQIGDLMLQPGIDNQSNGLYVFGGSHKSEGTPAKIVKAKKITPNVGKKFAFEGKGVMVNLLGQVVAKGAGSIDASSLANGVYYIVIDGVASKVIVK